MKASTFQAEGQRFITTGELVAVELTVVGEAIDYDSAYYWARPAAAQSNPRAGRLLRWLISQSAYANEPARPLNATGWKNR